MANGRYIALSGAVAASERLSVVANNVANVNTTGFKATQATFRSYMVAAQSPEQQSKGFVAMDETHVKTTQGHLQSTGNPLDLAIQGEGFFVLQGANGPELTRDGSFTLDSTGRLMTHDGRPVMSGDPASRLDEISVRSELGPVTITEQGDIEQGGTVLARLAVVTTDAKNLEPLGGASFTAPVESMKTAASASVQSGYLEASNVSAIHGLTEMIELSRDYTRAYKIMSKYSKLDSRLMSIA